MKTRSASRRIARFTLRALLVVLLAGGCFFGGAHFERERQETTSLPNPEPR